MKKLFSLIIIMAIFLSASVLTLPVQGAETADTVRYGYTTINEPNVKYVYEEIRDAMLTSTPPESIALARNKKISSSELKKAYMLFVSDYPECFWLYNSYNYSHLDNDVVCIYPKYSFTGEDLVAAKIALESSIAEIMRDLPSTDNYDKALYLHDVLAKKAEYEYVGEHQTAYGALVSGKAVCAGYTAAYQLLLNRAGISAWNVSGTAIHDGEEPMAHAWNVVWIEKDVCVYTDVTWNDGDDIFHYYFNVSKEDISSDHIVSDDIFILPECNHEDSGYFDINDLTVTDRTTMKELANFFGEERGGERDAVICYKGNDPESFLDRIQQEQDELYYALGGQTGTRGYQLTRVANEIHITVLGNFAPATYSVKISPNNTVKTLGDIEQYVKIGEAMSPQKFFASEGYYFPSNYSVEGLNGVNVTRVNARELLISGTPKANTTITLLDASRTRKEDTPKAIFTPTENGGILSEVEEGMKYSFDAVNWIEIASSEDIELTKINSSEVYVVKKGNGEDTDDSDVQTLPVSKLQKPTDTEPSTNTDKGNANINEPKLEKPNFGCNMTVGNCTIVMISSLAACGTVLKKFKNRDN